MNQNLNILIGNIEFCRNNIENFVITSTKNKPTKVNIVFKNHEHLFSISMLDQVVLKEDDKTIFCGLIEYAEKKDNFIHVHCVDYAVFLQDGLLRGYSKMGREQLMRLIWQAAGIILSEEPTNIIAKQSQTAINWDQLLSRLEKSSNLFEFKLILDEFLSNKKDISLEEQIGIKKIMQLVKQEIDSRSLTEEYAINVDNSAYAKAFPKIKANTWRLRKEPDKFIIIIPVKNLDLSNGTLQIGQVTFFSEKDNSLINTYAPKEYLEKNVDWQSRTFAKLKIQAKDFWQAKEVSIPIINEAIAALTLGSTYCSCNIKTDDNLYSDISFNRNTIYAYPQPGNEIFILNCVTDESWIGLPYFVERSLLLDENARQNKHEIISLLNIFLSKNADVFSTTDRRIKQSLNWYYKAFNSDSFLDRFILLWIALETMLVNVEEDSSSLIRRLPFVIASVGHKIKKIRQELQTEWLPLRNEIIHEALLTHLRAEEGAARLKFFTEKALIYGIGKSVNFPIFEDWLEYLDKLAVSEPQR